jgi:hypothetical protein
MAPNSTRARLSMLANTGRRIERSEIFIDSVPRHWSGTVFTVSDDVHALMSTLYTLVVRKTPESTFSKSIFLLRMGSIQDSA